MTIKLAYSPIAEPLIQNHTSTNNLELRLLPYWKGVKQYRSSTLRQEMKPQVYYQSILASNDHPTVASGKIVGFHTRADMYFSRLPQNIKLKLWRNFEAQANR